ncbi:uncharacterized protein LOC121881094 [Thunnus maccoyii]|uniref:uncharacterized protein LOC121881094 n=1 Tax=Thunnus maccoyii TaxID=8240 RepID=UPI001C4B81E7|nr:uncharacterized protein LOC121881094 [Thunnus maccoyii]
MTQMLWRKNSSSPPTHPKYFHAPKPNCKQPAFVTLEACPTERKLEKLYGYLSGYLLCLTGHRRGVLENMKAEEVAKHKNSDTFWHAHIVLKKQEHVWLERFLHHRHQLKGGDSDLVFFNTNGGVHQKLLEAFQNRRPDEKEQLAVRCQMCHSQTTAQAFYEAESDIREAWEAVNTQVGRPTQWHEEEGKLKPCCIPSSSTSSLSPPNFSHCCFARKKEGPQEPLVPPEAIQPREAAMQSASPANALSGP